MQGLSKETFLKAEDPRNRDAMLFDMLSHIDSKIDGIVKLKSALVKCEKQISYIKGVGASISMILAALLAWSFKG